MPTKALSRGWREPVLSVATMAVAIAAATLVNRTPQALVLVAVLALTFSRNRLVRSWRGRAEALLLLPVIALATNGVGYLLLHLPLVGAAAYVGVMFCSIWLRRFGALWTRIGGLLALPFITLLIVPGGGAGIAPWQAAALALAALVIAVAIRLLAEATRFLPHEEISLPEDETRPVPASSLKPIASTRMAIQLALALAASFTIGSTLFAGHVTWVVLTAFLVCSGNRGRADVLYKSGLRVSGAAAGTVVAMAIGHASIDGPALAILLLGIIGIGLWLREMTYAAWALAMTLVIALLQGVMAPAAGESAANLLWFRVLAIVVGALCGLVASWLVLPVRSEPIVRRRIAEALAALDEYIVEPDAAHDRALRRLLGRLDEITPPWQALAKITLWCKTMRPQPGHWIDLVHECTLRVRASPERARAARRALGEARRALKDPPSITPALTKLREQLQALA